MPLTPNGKIDRRKLPAPDLAKDRQLSASLTEQMQRATPTEAKLANLWEEVLGHPIGLDDSFFDAGGHSILATRLTFQMRRRLGLEFPLNLLYRYPTIRVIPRVIDEVANEPAAEAILEE